MSSKASANATVGLPTFEAVNGVNTKLIVGESSIDESSNAGASGTPAVVNLPGIEIYHRVNGELAMDDLSGGIPADSDLLPAFNMGTAQWWDGIFVSGYTLTAGKTEQSDLIPFGGYVRKFVTEADNGDGTVCGRWTYVPISEVFRLIELGSGSVVLVTAAALRDKGSIDFFELYANITATFNQWGKRPIIRYEPSAEREGAFVRTEEIAECFVATMALKTNFPVVSIESLARNRAKSKFYVEYYRKGPYTITGFNPGLFVSQADVTGWAHAGRISLPLRKSKD